MSKPSVYLETSVISYLTARISRDIITAANQQLTQEWWEDHRSLYDLYVSQIVLQEISRGDARAVQHRWQKVEELPILAVTEAVDALALALVLPGPLPVKAAVDAAHLALAAVSGIDYLLTWNCKHLANATIRKDIEHICLSHGCRAPILCTPQELLGDRSDVD